MELLLAAVLVAAAGSLLVGGLVQATRGTEARWAQMTRAQLVAGQAALLPDTLNTQTALGGALEPAGAGEWTLTVADGTGLAAPLKAVTVTVRADDATAQTVTARPWVE